MCPLLLKNSTIQVLHGNFLCVVKTLWSFLDLSIEFLSGAGHYLGEKRTLFKNNTMDPFTKSVTAVVLFHKPFSS